MGYPAHLKFTKTEARAFFNLACLQGPRPTTDKSLCTQYGMGDPYKTLAYCRQIQLALFTRTDEGQKLFGISGRGAGASAEHETLVRSAVAQLMDMAADLSRRHELVRGTYQHVSNAHGLKPNTFCLYKGFVQAVQSDEFFELRHCNINASRVANGLEPLPLPEKEASPASRTGPCRVAVQPPSAPTP